MNGGIALFGLRVRSKALLEEVLMQADKCNMRMLVPLPTAVAHDQEVILLLERT